MHHAIFEQENFARFYPTTSINLRVGYGRDQLMFERLPRDNKKDSVFDKIIIEWNALPLHIRNTASVNIFKVKLKTFLFKHAFGC